MWHTLRQSPAKLGRRLRLIEPLVYRGRQPLPPFRHCWLEGPLADAPVAPEIDDADWPVIPWGSTWGQINRDFVLRSSLVKPREWNPGEVIALALPIGQAGDFSHPEAQAYIDGRPCAACDRHHQEILLPEWALDGNPHTLALVGWTGNLGDALAGRLLMSECAIVRVDQATRDFIASARVALGVADQLDENEPARGSLYAALEQAFRLLDTREPLGDGFYASVPIAHEALRQGIARAGRPLDVDITAVGHAHIDLAWLWTLGQTRRKGGRTFHNVLRLMEQFPEFRFSQSQPQLYDFVRQDYPELFSAIRRRVQEGRWEPLGGMWVEADCNISGGESLVRQLVLGRGFFREQFGAAAESPVLWLPDVFGYAWNLPQLLKGAGLEYFFTVKLGWNDTNRLPYDSFWWQGLDGTRVLTHCSPTTPPHSRFAGTYNSDASPAEALGTWTNFRQKDWGRPGVTAPLLMSFGHGDGGGGPTREMVENIREMAEFPAAPRLHCGSVGDFFRRLEREMGDRLPTWNGELYLEYHRGTYTTQGRNKQANRRSEFLLHDAEFLATLAWLSCPGAGYPHAELRQAWQLLCLNQFHDIIPGSSIGPVYAESQQQYAQIRQIGTSVRDRALDALGRRLGGDLLVVNPTSFGRGDLAFWPHDAATIPALRRADGSPVVVQPVDGGLLLDAGELPPYSITPLFLRDRQPGAPGPASSLLPPVSAIEATPACLENDCLRVELDAAGDIVRIRDKVKGREVLPAGAVANQLQAFEDRPLDFDAWNIDISYDEKMWLAEPARSVRVVEAGPLRATLEVRRRLLGSDVVQRLSLCRGAPRLDFDTLVDWRERHILLKTAFPVDVLATRATYEIQWGSVERPTHRNTSWDWARFETCAQKWVDLSEAGYGASLINDCKYGHDIHDNIICLTLLRSPTDPDPEADRGEHRFAYSLLPHSGSWDQRTVGQAYALNDPLLLWAGAVVSPTNGGGAPVCPSSFVSVDRPHGVIETVKRAEDGRGVIVRLYESQRRRGECKLAVAFPIQAAWLTNLLEENQEALVADGHCVRFFIKPFQIVTLRLEPE